MYLCVCSVVSDSAIPWTVANQAPLSTYSFPDKNNVVGCHFLLETGKIKYLYHWPNMRIKCPHLQILAHSKCYLSVRDFPGGPAAKIPPSQFRGSRFDP